MTGYKEDKCARCNKRRPLVAFDETTGDICGECSTKRMAWLYAEIKRTRDRYDGLLGDREKPAPKREVDA